VKETRTLLFFFLVVIWDLNAGLCAYKSGALQLEPHLPSVHFALVILEMQVLQSFCPGWL
jgi:hypothetical protein